MGSFASLSDILNRLSGGNSGAPEHIWTYRTGLAAGVAPSSIAAAVPYRSFWLQDGQPGGPGAAPGAAAVPTNATAGGVMQTDPAGGKQKYLIAWSACGNCPGHLILYDRLFHVSGFSATSTATNTVQGSPASPALTRYTNGVGNQIWAEVYTTIGATPTTITCNYTNQDGTSGQTTYAAPFAATNQNVAGQIIPIPLASGDTGVQAVNTATLAGSTGTAGNWGITIAHPIATTMIGNIGHGALRDEVAGYPVLPEILTGACLAFAILPTRITVVPTLMAALHMAEV